MNFSEFKERLGAEPRSDDADLLAAARSGPEFEAAAREAASLEDRIEATLRFPVDEGALLSGILDIPAEEAAPRRSGFRWMAMAASLVVMVGAAWTIGYMAGQPETLEDYVVSHFRHDGDAVVGRMDPAFDPTEVNAVLASFGAEAGPALTSQVGYIKICPTLHAKGAHMVLATAEGPVTVIYMPETTVGEPVLLQFDGMQAEVITVGAGAAAIIAPEGQSPARVQTLLREQLQPLSADA